MTALTVTERATNREMILVYVELCLFAVLRGNDVVVADNFTDHEIPGVRKAIENARATLRYLPKYSPDLNPIELLCSKLRALLGKAAHVPYQQEPPSSPSISSNY